MPPRRPRVTRALRLAAVAAASACVDLTDPGAFTGADVLSVQAARHTALADGTTRTEIVATLLGDTPTGTELTFATDAGSFAGAPADTPRELKVKSPSREIRVLLVSGVDPTLATVSVTAGGFLATDTVRLAPAPPESIELLPDMSSAPADGQSAIALAARVLRAVGAGTVSRGTRVQFQVMRNGAAVPELSASAETDTAGSARRTITSRVPGVYRVVASVGTVADTVEVEFTTP